MLLHGCCHNPTGANLTYEQMAQVINLMQNKGAVPFVDIAYQGFGDGLAADAIATRQIASSFENCLIAASCSKNFGIYRERTGDSDGRLQRRRPAGPDTAKPAFLNRQNYSFPPDHGARVVTTILKDPALRADWEAELEETRNGMLALRQQLADELKTPDQQLTALIFWPITAACSAALARRPNWLKNCVLITGFTWSATAA